MFLEAAGLCHDVDKFEAPKLRSFKHMLNFNRHPPAVLHSIRIPVHQAAAFANST
jgi:hypothetical protein